ncbi:hypothetical protein ACFQ5N_02305 [Lutibacter holmesii]|uniref:Phage terminase small subunit P27 family n=1 Tax=Lutibacter holmesii TaxID=1137985 RepID=A0ABW3WME7_9FLAO
MKVVHNSNGIKQHEEPPTSEEKALYEILEKLPQPRKYFNLNQDQKKLWYWFGSQFLSTKQFVEGDLVHLQNAAISLDARNKMIAVINKLNAADKINGTAGWVQVFANKTTNVSGYQTMYEKATKQLNEVSAHFGLSFRDRKKLAMESAETGQLDLFETFLQKQAL